MDDLNEKLEEIRKSLEDIENRLRKINLDSVVKTTEDASNQIENAENTLKTRSDRAEEEAIEDLNEAAAKKAEEADRLAKEAEEEAKRKTAAKKAEADRLKKEAEEEEKRRAAEKKAEADRLTKETEEEAKKTAAKKAEEVKKSLKEMGIDTDAAFEKIFEDMANSFEKISSDLEVAKKRFNDESERQRKEIANDRAGYNIEIIEAIKQMQEELYDRLLRRALEEQTQQKIEADLKKEMENYKLKAVKEIKEDAKDEFEFDSFPKKYRQRYMVNREYEKKGRVRSAIDSFRKTVKVDGIVLKLKQKDMVSYYAKDELGKARYDFEQTSVIDRFLKRYQHNRDDKSRFRSFINAFKTIDSVDDAIIKDMADESSDNLERLTLQGTMDRIIERNNLKKENDYTVRVARSKTMPISEKQREIDRLLEIYGDEEDKEFATKLRQEMLENNEEIVKYQQVQISKKSKTPEELNQQEHDL